MASRSVYFATNRDYDPWRQRFGATPAGGEAPLWAGFAICQPAPSPTADGTLLGFEVAQPKAPEAGLQQTLADWLSAAAGEEVPLLFVHGFNFTFAEALVRAADVAAWLEGAEGAPRIRPLLFSWPSHGLGTAEAYRHDRQHAAGAAPSLARLVRAIAAARPQAAARPVLLAHSMGVYALRCGLQALAPPWPVGLFRHAFVMAGDERVDVFAAPGHSESAGGLRPLAAMAEGVTIGFPRDDGVVWLVSGKLFHQEPRLGAAGPLPRNDLPANAAAVDYSMLATKPPPWVPQTVPNGEMEVNWTAHQYYRNNPAVRADMLAAIAAGGGPVKGRRKGERKPLDGKREDPDCWYPEG
jgi:esterase/lipase superfamily enzyme